MAVYFTYGTDVSVKAVLNKGNFDQMRAEIENISKFAKVYLATKDTRSYSCLLSGEVHHLTSKFYSLPEKTLGKLIGSVLFAAVGIISVIRHSKEIDVLVSQGTISLQGSFAHLVFRKPHILFLQYFAYKEQFLLRRQLIGALFKPIESFAIRQSSIVIAPNKNLKHDSIAHGAKIALVIPNFVQTKKIDELPSKSALRRKLGFAKDVKFILFVGRLHRVKNIELVLRAFARLRRLEKIILFIIGDGPEKERLIDLALNLGINNSVHFAGFKCNNEVLEFMKASDVLVLPSIVEGQPRVILESWACELPVVASRVTGISNLVTNRYDGLLFDLASEEECSKAISTALKGDVAATLVVNAKKNLVPYYEESVLFRQEKIIRDCVTKNQKGYS